MTALVIQQVPASTSNYTSGREGHRPHKLVVHVMDGSLAGTDSWFANPAAHVSAHYGVGAAGQVHQYVAETDTAWHAGRFDVNLDSVGIEHEGRQVKGKPAWVPTDLQLEASARLAAAVCGRWNIRPGSDTIVRHSVINPKHALCPGPGFPLERYIARVAALLAEDQAQDAQEEPLLDPQTQQVIGAVTLRQQGGKRSVYLKRLTT